MYSPHPLPATSIKRSPIRVAHLLQVEQCTNCTTANKELTLTHHHPPKTTVHLRLTLGAVRFMGVCVCKLFTHSYPTLQRHGLQPARLLCPLDSPSKNTELGCLSSLQGHFMGLDKCKWLKSTMIFNSIVQSSFTDLNIFLCSVYSSLPHANLGNYQSFYCLHNFTFSQNGTE